MKCSVVFDDGTWCPRDVRDYPARGWCDPCGVWSRRHGGTDPCGRKPPRRTSAELIGELRIAAHATTEACVDLGGYKNRPNVKFQGKIMEASRAVWWIANGDPGATAILHTCHRGEEGCINIRHLYAGDNIRNVRDRAEAGRSCQGEHHWAAKLSDADAAEIRRRYRPGTRWNPGNAIALGGEFGVSAEQVSRIARRKQRLAA